MSSRRCSEIYNLTDTHPITITDNEIVFFFIVKNPRLHESLEDVLSLYANTYPMLSSDSCQ